MLVEYFKTLYDYNYWANAKILEAAEQVSEAQFIEETSQSQGSLRGTLVHLLSAEWIWRSRWQGTSPVEDLREEDLPTPGALREEERQMRAFLAALSEKEVQRVVRYINTRGHTSSISKPGPSWKTMVGKRLIPRPTLPVGK